MRSTYDRSGGNEGADASHFLYQEADNFNVALDVEGPGVLYFARDNHWHGSPWHYEVDGTDHRVAESSTADPNHPVDSSVFLPRELFPRPLAWTWSDTRARISRGFPSPSSSPLRMAYSPRTTARATSSTTVTCRGRTSRVRCTPGTPRPHPTPMFSSSSSGPAATSFPGRKILRESRSACARRPAKSHFRRRGPSTWSGSLKPPRCCEPWSLTCRGPRRWCVASPAPRHMGRPASSFHRRPGRPLLRCGDLVQTRWPGVPGEGLSGERAR